MPEMWNRILSGEQRKRHRERSLEHYHTVAKPKYTAARYRAYRYGLTEERYQEMLKAQEGKCALCRSEAPLHVDHCHKTKKVRGLLCQACNTGIGKLRDDPDLMRRAAEYVCS